MISAPRKEKRRTILFAKAHGNWTASREYNVPENNVRLWRGHRDAIFLCSSTCKRFRGKPTAHPKLEEILAVFVTDQCSKKLPVTRRIFALKAQTIAAENGIVNFKSSEGWIDNFLRRK